MALSTLVKLLWLWTYAPSAWACAVCGAGQDESSMAFFRGTMLLSLVPLGMLAGITYYLYRRTRPTDVQVHVQEATEPQ